MNKITRSIQILLGVFLFCIHYTTVAQTLLPPTLHFGASACDDAPVGDKNFLIDISYSGSLFNDDNKFIVELSDADGNFGSPAVKLTEVNTPIPNNKFKIDNVGFTLPPGTFGKNYKIRIRTTSPVVTSVESSSFEAYYNMFVDGGLSIQDASGNNKPTLCPGQDLEVFLSTTAVGQYQWYRENGAVDILVATTQDPKYTITAPGLYYVVVDYGICKNAESVRILVTGISNADAQIANVSAIEEICSTKDYELKASINNSSYTYKWYYNGVEKQSSNSNTYIIPAEGQFGKYRLDIDTGDCTTTSNEVELKQKSSASFSITTVNSGESVMLPCETKKAEVTGAPSGATVQWYRNDIALTGQNLFEFNITSPGEYYAIVTDPTSSSSCPATVKSETYSVFTLKKFIVDIRTQDTNYTECESTTAKLVIIGVKASVEENANEYDLTDDQLNETSPVLIRYQWHKDGNPITTGGTGKELDINSYLDNGEYELEVKSCILGTQNGKSAKTSVKLAAPLPTITSMPNSNSLCPGGTITYKIGGGLLPGFTYEWFKDGGTTAVATNVVDFAVTEIGEYVLKMTGFGCERSIAPINVVLFDESAIEVTPSVKVVLNQGQTVTVTASGGESYVWHEGQDDTGTVLSTNETLDVNALGFYTVVVSVGSCSVVKTIEVVEQDDQIIVPNIVTPNQDGVNDTWQISNRYAFQPTVTIQLYNSNGKEILNTTDYQNNWPTESLGNQRVFYYKIIRDDVLIKAGTISVLD
ncbi:gliding motility-associated C-terminal domain-containing protein [uncultured Tenacibaculum sp.]|uniref:T9SS type B sorting domain-containing protein n=1 Tax=uncultured Tenacibaculum sp. TaxID=174713 RepID=UPI0026347590|nr:gliding motility-associated C-terminal domain-containing protein [uncultured Tenacibaculum sp.]